MSVRPVTQAQLSRLMRVAGRKSRIALMGEFSAGKSTLFNLLMGQELARTQVTATHLPAIWWRRGSDPRQWLFRHDGQMDGFRDVARPDAPLDLARHAMVRIETDAPALEDFDVIDTPGISDPMMPDVPLRMIAGHCDFVIWCTTAVQAWRQSEASAWQDLPTRLARGSVLAVTGIDRLTPENAQKVLARLRRETAGRFRAIVPIATLDAARALEMDDSSQGARLWQDSGGAVLLQEMERSRRAAMAHRQALLARYVVGDAPARIVAPAPVQEAEDLDIVLARWDALTAGVTDADALRAALTEFRRATPLNGVLDALLSPQGSFDDPVATTFQMRGELEAFSKTAWRDLA
jgi:hypothetical protein